MPDFYSIQKVDDNHVAGGVEYSEIALVEFRCRETSGEWLTTPVNSSEVEYCPFCGTSLPVGDDDGA